MARVLTDRGLAGSPVIVGRDARHDSPAFAAAAARVLPPAGRAALPDPAPTPVVDSRCGTPAPPLGYRSRRHAAATDNGYRSMADGGLQLLAPTDRQIEARWPPRPPGRSGRQRPSSSSHSDLIIGYISVRPGSKVRRFGRVAPDAAAQVGGDGRRDHFSEPFTGCATVATQFAPVDFPTGDWAGRATDALLTWLPTWTPTSRSRWIPMDRCGQDTHGVGMAVLSGDETVGTE